MDIGDGLRQALRHQQAGRAADAEAACRAVLAAAPGQPDALHILGVVAFQQGRIEAAIDLYRQALARHPAYHAALVNLAIALGHVGRTGDAIDAWRRALALQPRDAGAQLNLGKALAQLGRNEEAAAAFRAATESDPSLADAHAWLGVTLAHAGRPVEAEAAHRRAVVLRPDSAVALTNLGAALYDQGRFDEAIDAYRRALALAPGLAMAQGNLANALRATRRHDEALAAYRAAIALEPGASVRHANLAVFLSECGRWADSIAAFDAAIAHAGDGADALRIRRALALPVIMEDRAMIDAARDGLERAVDALLATPLRVERPDEALAGAAFHLAYHGRDDRALQAKIARLHLHACPQLAWTAPHCAPGRRRADAGRVRLGIVSAYLRDHTIGRLVHGLVERMPRDRLEVVVFRRPAPADAMARAIDAAADRVVALPPDLDGQRRAVADAAPDALLYPDIGMDTQTYFLAFARLAPVQCVTWGHPVTTGIPAIDYFLSCSDLEPPGAEGHYGERLIRHRCLPACYARPAVADATFDRRAAGLPDDAALYVCPQSPFKLHPDFDAAIGGILRGDPAGRVVLLRGTDAHFEALLRARFARTIPDVADRIAFLGWMPRREFLGLVAAAHAMLDPFHFGGGNSSFEAMAAGTPVVTWPGAFARGRVTLALYRQLGIDDAVARDADDYVRIAVRLGRDAAERARLSALIGARSGALFDTAEPAVELARFFVAAVDAARRGERLDGPPA